MRRVAGWLATATSSDIVEADERIWRGVQAFPPVPVISGPDPPMSALRIGWVIETDALTDRRQA